MKILQIFDCYGIPNARALPGGENGSVASVVYYLSKHLVLKGYDVTILERDLGGKLSREEYIDGIRYCRIPAKSLPAHPYRLIRSLSGLTCLLTDSYIIAKKIEKFIEHNDFDIIHFHFPFAASVLVSLNKKIREKIVYTAHVGEESKRFGFTSDNLLPLRIFQPDIYLMKRTKKSIILNENLKYKLIKKGLKEERIEVIPNGIDINEFNSLKIDEDIVREKFKLNDKVLLLFVGKIIPRKGVKVLLEAVKLIVKSGHNDFVLFLVGDTSLDTEFYNRMVSYVKSNGLEKFIKFMGFVSYNDLKALYYICDIFVFPSFEEGDPIALKEALASGKPLIGSNVGGIPMQIRDGWNGFLVEPGNEKQLAEKIMYLIDNEEERKRMGKNSKRLAEDKFDWNKIAEKYIKVYEEVAG